VKSSPAEHGHCVVSNARKPSVALEAVFARDELRAIAGLQPAPDEITAAQIWAQDIKFGPVLEQIPAAKHHHALGSFKAANPERWHEVLRNSLNFVSAKLCREFANLLIQEGKMDLLKETLARLVNQHTAGSELLLWLGRERSDAFCRHSRAGGFSRDAHRDGAGSIQRKTLEPAARIHFG